MKKTNFVTTGDLRFDWNLIQSFLAVMDEGSLQAASRALGHSQPTMGRHIEQLEEQLNVVLFERTGRAVVPTNNAHQISEIARNMQGDADTISRMAQQNDRAVEGSVRITASRMVTNHLLADILYRLQETAPELDISVVSTDDVSNLLKRDADIAVRMIKPSQSDLIAKRIGEIEILPCASKKYIDKWGMPSNVDELLNHRLVWFDKENTVQTGISVLAKEAGKELKDIRLVYRSDDLAAQAAAIKAGIGIGLTPKFYLQQNRDMVELSVDIPKPQKLVWLAVHREIRTTPRIRLVYDELTKHIEEAIA